MRQPVFVLLLTGTVGSGKSTIAAEINDVLAEREVPNAALDLDALTWQWPSDSVWNTDLMFESLAALWPIYERPRVRRLVLARVLEDASELDRYRSAIPGAHIAVCRLLVPERLRIERLMDRMPAGPTRDWHIRRTVELEHILEEKAHEDFTVANGTQPVRAVALQILERARWG